ncbi:hypothetical protein SAMN05444004_101479 [Jannaschia faecimaris]|uniref:Uncharacterized protein n=1 Tax=Jannaschia faecimaris TaxID=1244108 RepID=A0A1H3K0T7_9RHOB|nr:hypothetical protein [Jannaschia faecimaris]SDY45385.1 hypothetical protein SAMN05444004_101479 [Jannaschia faecimaris]
MRLFPNLIKATFVLATLAAPALADEVTGEILAYDRQANIIIFGDRTVWLLGALLVPGDLTAGYTVTLTFTSDGDNGMKKADALTRAN